MLESEFTDMLKKHTEAARDRRVFAALAKDLFPGQTRETHLLSTLHEMGLPGDIAGEERITHAFAYRFVKRMMGETGVSRAYADWAVAMWCVCYGKNILRKTCEIQLVGATPSIRTPHRTGQYQDLFTYVPNPDGSGVAVSGFTGDNHRTIIVPHKHGALGVTAIAAGAFAKSDVSEAIMTDGLASVGDEAFADCVNLTQVILPDTLVSIGDEAFAGCARLRTAALPPRLDRIGARAFAGSGLGPAVLPVSLRILGDGAFERCPNLAEMTIPEGVTALPTALFSGCEKLVKVTLSDRIQSIGARAFADCPRLSSLHVPDGVRQIGEEAFGSGRFVLLCGRGSWAERYARENGVRFQFV